MTVAMNKMHKARFEVLTTVVMKPEISLDVILVVSIILKDHSAFIF
jgi:hypothetical protein